MTQNNKLAMKRYDKMNMTVKEIESLTSKSRFVGSAQPIGDISTYLDGQNKFILYLGLNPSDANEEKENQKFTEKHCPFLFHLPEKKGFEKERKSLNEKGLTYSKYFSRAMRLFQPEYNLLWYNPLYQDDNFSNAGLSSSELRFLNEFTKEDSKNYVVFSDLIPFRKRDSKEVVPLLWDKKYKELQAKIYKLFRLQVAYLQPELVIIANKEAAWFIAKSHDQNNSNVDWDELTSFDFIEESTGRKIPVILSGIISQGMDEFSFRRLKNEIANNLLNV